MPSWLGAVLGLGIVLLPLRHCLDNGLAITPPMGYNTWNAFHEEIDETMVRESAEILISSGLAAAGYTYFNLDGMKSRLQSRIIPMHVMFPFHINYKMVCTGKDGKTTDSFCSEKSTDVIPR